MAINMATFLQLDTFLKLDDHWIYSPQNNFKNN